MAVTTAEHHTVQMNFSINFDMADFLEWTSVVEFKTMLTIDCNQETIIFTLENNFKVLMVMKRHAILAFLVTAWVFSNLVQFVSCALPYVAAACSGRLAFWFLLLFVAAPAPTPKS